MGELLRRISFDRPEFVTPFTLGLLGALVVVSLAAFAGAALRSPADTVRERQPPPAGSNP